MLTLLTFPGSFELPSHSPFCVKAMALLNLSGQAWAPKYLSNPANMPMGRLPVLKTPDRLVPDSGAIQHYLEGCGAVFDDGLGPRDRAVSHALIRMTEENLRCGLVHDRWLRDDCWPAAREAFFATLPAPLRRLVPALVRRKVRRAMTLQGIAQFPETERRDRLAQDLHAIETVLDGKPYLFGDSPGAADCAIAPVLDMIRTLPCDTGLRRMVRENTALMGYIGRARPALYTGQAGEPGKG